MSDRDVRCLSGKSLSAGMKKVGPPLCQPTARVLGGIMPFTGLATDVYTEFFFDSLHHLGRCIEAGQSLNNEGFDLAS